MKRKPIITFTDVAFSYSDKPFLQDINLTIYQHDFLGVVGPNGGGKTTFLKLLLGLLTPQKGSIQVFGTTPQNARDKMGYLSQFKNIDFDFPITVLEIVLSSRVGKNIMKRLTKEDKEIARKALLDIGIWDLRNKTLSELSGGEKQRVFVARALAKQPSLLILDEPMANIDIHTQEEFYRLLKKLNRRMAIVIVDHDLDMVAQYAKEIVCINKCNKHAIKYHDAQSVLKHTSKEKVKENHV